MTESRRGSREREQIRNDRIIRDRRRERKGVKQEGDVDGGEGQNCLDLPRPAKTFYVGFILCKGWALLIWLSRLL